MCGISGFCNFTKDYTDSPEAYSRILNHMQKVQAHRGPDDHGSFLSSHVGLSHARLSIIDLNGGHQPMTCTSQEYSCTIVYNGELYNTRELHKGLKGLGISFETASDTEVILRSYMDRILFSALMESSLLLSGIQEMKDLFYIGIAAV